MNLLRRRQRTAAAAAPLAPPDLPPRDIADLGSTFASPRWLRDLGRTAWLLVGVFALVAALVWFLGATYTIGGPVVAATIVATVAMPLAGRLAQHMPRAAAAVLVLVGLVAFAVVI